MATDTITKETPIIDEFVWLKKLSATEHSLLYKIVHSDEATIALRILISFIMVAAIAGIILRVNYFVRIAFIFTFVTGSFYLAFHSFLEYIDTRDIDEYPTSLSEKFMLRVMKKYSYSRGYYLIGTVNGIRVGLSRMSRFLHTLIAAPTGAEKSSCSIIPQLMMDSDSRGSAVVPCAKSPELFGWTAGRWLKDGKRAVLFDPWHPDTVGINFLPGADDQTILTVVEVMMREREEAIGKEDPFFTSRTRYLLYAILKLVQSFNDAYCNMSTVYNVVQSVEILEGFIKAAPPEIAPLFADFKDLRDETRVNALTSIREKLDVFMDEKVRKAFSKSEFKLEDLFTDKQPCLLVLGAPIDKKQPGTKIASLIINLIINMAFQKRRLQNQAQQKGAKKISVNDLYLYLDEMRSLRVTSLPDLVSIARGTRTHIIGSITDIFFLKYYRQDFSSLMANFRTKIYMKGLDLESAKYVSDSIGKETRMSYMYMRDLMARPESVNIMDPDKVSNLPDDKLLVFSPHTPPFIADKVSIYRTDWIKKMHIPPPPDMRVLYRSWGISKEDLIDPVLPLISGYYDMAKIKSDKKKVSVDPTITLVRFKEMGGGGYSPYQAEGTIETQGYILPVRKDDGPEIAGGTQ